MAPQHLVLLVRIFHQIRPDRAQVPVMRFAAIRPDW
jgi:hypothetical protein